MDKHSWVPLQLRENNLYDKVGELFGKIARRSELSRESNDNSSGQRRLPVWVKETVNPRLQGFVESLSSAVPVTPLKSVGSVNRWVIDLEEGEIRNEEKNDMEVDKKIAVGRKSSGGSDSGGRGKGRETKGLHGDEQEPEGSFTEELNAVQVLRNNHSTIGAILDFFNSHGKTIVFKTGLGSVLGCGPNVRSHKKVKGM
ncbi:hypothetical protein Hanom_Chr12g01118531 [Helianthus anomalus]